MHAANIKQGLYKIHKSWSSLNFKVFARFSLLSVQNTYGHFHLIFLNYLMILRKLDNFASSVVSVATVGLCKTRAKRLTAQSCWEILMDTVRPHISYRVSELFSLVLI